MIKRSPMGSGMHGFHVFVWLPQVPSYLASTSYTCQLLRTPHASLLGPTISSAGTFLALVFVHHSSASALL